MPTDLAELYCRDPLKLSQQDIEEIIKAQRASRGQFSLGNMKAGRAAKPVTEMAKALSVLASKLELKL